MLVRVAATVFIPALNLVLGIIFTKKKGISGHDYKMGVKVTVPVEVGTLMKVWQKGVAVAARAGSRKARSTWSARQAVRSLRKRGFLSMPDLASKEWRPTSEAAEASPQSPTINIKGVKRKFFMFKRKGECSLYRCVGRISVVATRPAYISSSQISAPEPFLPSCPEKASFILQEASIWGQCSLSSMSSGTNRCKPCMSFEKEEGKCGTQPHE
jgi:hypothetical protein